MIYSIYFACLFIISVVYIFYKGYTNTLSIRLLAVLMGRLLISYVFHIATLVTSTAEYGQHLYMLVSYLHYAILFAAIYVVSGTAYPDSFVGDSPSSIRLWVFSSTKRIIAMELVSLAWIHSVLLLVSPIAFDKSADSSSWLITLLSTSQIPLKKQVCYSALTAVALGWLLVNVRQRTANLRTNTAKLDQWSADLMIKAIDRQVFTSIILYVCYTTLLLVTATNALELSVANSNLILNLIECSFVLSFTITILKLITYYSTHSAVTPLSQSGIIRRNSIAPTNATSSPLLSATFSTKRRHSINVVSQQPHQTTTTHLSVSSSQVKHFQSNSNPNSPVVNGSPSISSPLLNLNSASKNINNTTINKRINISTESCNILESISEDTISSKNKID